MLLQSVFFSFLCIVSGYNFPKPDKICEKNDLKCLMKLTQILQEVSVPGIDEIGVKPLDPMKLALIDINEPDLEFSLSDTKVTGFKDMTINDLIITKDKLIIMHYTFSLPRLEVTGNYKINGKITGLPINGQGQYHFSATNVQLIVTLAKYFYQKDGETYLRLVDNHSQTEIKGITQFHADNLYYGKNRLENEIPKIISELWLQYVTPVSVDLLVDDYNKVLGSIPITKLVNGG